MEAPLLNNTLSTTLGNTDSSTVVGIIEVLNEMFTAVGAGLLGIGVIIKYGFQENHIIRTTAMVSVTAGCLYYVYRTSEREKPCRKKLVLISGCDSGLGFSLAHHTAKLGFTVVAGFLSLESKGAHELRRLFADDIKQIELNITSSNSVQLTLQYIERLVSSGQGLELYAVVNNAGVMVFGEFEWLTEKLIESQIDVNLMGTLRLTKAFCPLLRHFKGRIITVSSHCAESCLPGLSVYGSTKTALKGWCDSIRVELNKYGVKVIQLIPGSFITQSNIMSKHSQYVYEMHEGFTPEQHNFYGEYFKRYHSYLAAISRTSEPQVIDNRTLYGTYEGSLLDTSPRAVYKNEPLRYFFYHKLFKYSPVSLRDYFVTKFVQMPEYGPDYKDVDIVG